MNYTCFSSSLFVAALLFCLLADVGTINWTGYVHCNSYNFYELVKKNVCYFQGQWKQSMKQIMSMNITLLSRIPTGGGRPAGYLQAPEARPRTWIRDYGEQKPTSNRSGTWTRNLQMPCPVPQSVPTLPLPINCKTEQEENSYPYRFFTSVTFHVRNCPLKNVTRLGSFGNPAFGKRRKRP